MYLAPTELTTSERNLREEVKEFLAHRLPAGSYQPGLGMIGGTDPAFSRDLGSRGWLGMNLPREYGGAGRSAVDRLVVVEELLAVGAPVAYHWVGDRQSGPNILRNGTEEQKQYFLPRIVSGEVSFAIGMSEPDAGSDLASLRTRAQRVDGGWLVNGTKVWTTSAATATHILSLFRTGEDRHRGLTQFIVDASVPGLTISPIAFIDGTEDFCELSFRDCFIPDEWRLGPEGGGWGQNTDELALERGGVDRWISSMTILDAWVAGMEQSEIPADLTRDLGWLAAHLWNLRGMSLAIARMVDAGTSPVLAAALAKEIATSFERRTVDVVQRHRGTVPSITSPDRLEALLARAILVSPSWTLRGGTNEVLRNVIAKGLLNR